MPVPAVVVCLVIAVADGSALRVRCTDGERSVRIAGIEAPALQQPAGPSSRQALVSLCQDEQASIVWRTQTVDGRPVADVACSGVDVAAAQAGAGWAWVRDSRDPADAALPAMQANARAMRRGLWAWPNPVPPWQWRRAGERSA